MEATQPTPPVHGAKLNQTTMYCWWYRFGVGAYIRTSCPVFVPSLAPRTWGLALL